MAPLFARKPKRPRREITEAEAFERLSEGFEWDYSHPIATFLLCDGSVLMLERHFGGFGRWYDCGAPGPGERPPPERWESGLPRGYEAIVTGSAS